MSIWVASYAGPIRDAYGRCWMVDFVKGEAMCQGNYSMGGTWRGGWELDKEGTSRRIIPRHSGVTTAGSGHFWKVDPVKGYTTNSCALPASGGIPEISSCIFYSLSDPVGVTDMTTSSTTLDLHPNHSMIVLSIFSPEMKKKKIQTKATKESQHLCNLQFANSTNSQLLCDLQTCRYYSVMFEPDIIL
jgi:hypothetical protein